MGNYKVILICLISFICVGCGSSDEMVSKTKYDNIVEHCNQLEKQRQNTLETNEKNAEFINDIFYELNKISGRTYQLQVDVENNGAYDRQEIALQISEDIDIIKEKLNKVSSQGADKQLFAVIDNLRETIRIKEMEIENLKVVIQRQNEELLNKEVELQKREENIKELDTHVESLDNKLHDANQIIQNSEMNQWFDLGRQLLDASNLLPSTKGHGNMKKIKKAKLEIIQRSIDCFEKSAKMGHDEAPAYVVSTRALYYKEKAR